MVRSFAENKRVILEAVRATVAQGRIRVTVRDIGEADIRLFGPKRTPIASKPASC